AAEAEADLPRPPRADRRELLERVAFALLVVALFRQCGELEQHLRAHLALQRPAQERLQHRARLLEIALRLVDAREPEARVGEDPALIVDFREQRDRLGWQRALLVQQAGFEGAARGERRV